MGWLAKARKLQAMVIAVAPEGNKEKRFFASERDMGRIIHPSQVFVGVQGIKPCASKSRTWRATDAPHPEGPRQESNLHRRFRKPLLYPLSYEDVRQLYPYLKLRA